MFLRGTQVLIARSCRAVGSWVGCPWGEYSRMQALPHGMMMHMHEGMPEAPKSPENKVNLTVAEEAQAMERLYAKEVGSGFSDNEVVLYTRLLRSSWISKKTIGVEVPQHVRLESAAVVEEWVLHIEEWKTQFPVEQLFAIERLTVEEAAVHPLRAPAQKALAALSDRLFYIEHFTNISTEDVSALKKLRGDLGKALGVIVPRTGVVDHTRC